MHLDVEPSASPFAPFNAGQRRFGATFGADALSVRAADTDWRPAFVWPEADKLRRRVEVKGLWASFRRQSGTSAADGGGGAPPPAKASKASKQDAATKQEELDEKAEQRRRDTRSIGSCATGRRRRDRFRGPKRAMVC